MDPQNSKLAPLETPLPSPGIIREIAQPFDLVKQLLTANR
jgi:hypothetical protein